ncbi:hypothetical protein J1N35_004207 [Gossypium stocksii]|uniref:RNase H type-1 domain-containing protein n=1 Tax=Gossypium stocksii TaxID=47602 RepID=A0A9D3WBK7_9ROSI|nr:hypothetical protein J1N35_004207 [Gossypium stocksii]
MMQVSLLFAVSVLCCWSCCVFAGTGVDGSRWWLLEVTGRYWVLGMGLGIGLRELIAERLVWRVGSDARINIWNDSWLPRRENNRISVQKIIPNWTTVNQLIGTETNTWDKELIHKIVDEGTTDRILSIPIFRANSEDMMVWKYEGSGEYTVKSGYRVLSTELLQNHASTFPTDDDYRGFYKSLWNMYIPMKIKIHIWRLINDLLPHYYNLARRSFSVEVVCPFCKVDPEDSVLARNSEGDIVAAETHLFTDVSDTYVVEAMACERALLFALERGYRHLVVEGDSLTVIKSIKKKEKDKSVLRPITYQISFLEKCFGHVAYTFVPRLVKRMAHTLALEGRRTQAFGV